MTEPPFKDQVTVTRGGEYRFRPEVQVKFWDDGIVVFSAASAQTALLSTEWQDVVEALLLKPDGHSVAQMAADDRLSLLLEHLIRISAIDCAADDWRA